MNLSKYRNIFSFGIVFLFTTVVLFKTGIYFETNNDRIITELFSGSLTGNPDAHIFCINYILSTIFRVLYSLSTHVPWYGLFLVCAQIFALFMIVNSLLKKCTNIFTILLTSGISFALLLSSLFILSSIQFTSVAALLAIAGYAQLLTGTFQKKDWWVFFILELIALLLRRDAMLMIQPYGACLFICKLLQDNLLQKAKLYSIYIYIYIL